MKYLLIIILLLITASISPAQITKPLPVDNKFMTMCIGTWVSEPFEFNNEKWIDRMSIKWTLNNQFLNIYTVRTSDLGNEYSSLEIMGVDKYGNEKSWSFDDFGIDFASTEEGKIINDKLILSGKNSKSIFNANIYFEDENRLIFECVSSPVNNPENKMTNKIIFNRK